MGGFLFFCAVVANSHTERYRILQEEEADDGDEEGYYPQNRLDEAELDEFVVEEFALAFQFHESVENLSFGLVGGPVPKGGVGGQWLGGGVLKIFIFLQMNLALRFHELFDFALLAKIICSLITSIPQLTTNSSL